MHAFGRNSEKSHKSLYRIILMGLVFESVSVSSFLFFVCSIILLI